MNRFSATTESQAVVAADRSAIWAALTDAELLPTLTPLLRKIDTDGDLWRWHLIRIAALGVSISPAFTERMRFEDERRIEFTHEPPPGVRERASAEGFYELTDVRGGTHLAISLTLCVELPLPRLAAPAVDKVMSVTMQQTGERFSANLLKYLGTTEVVS
jgi:carbon monoxide dehydrogenase subunit G